MKTLSRRGIVVRMILASLALSLLACGNIGNEHECSVFNGARYNRCLRDANACDDVTNNMGAWEQCMEAKGYHY